LSTGLNKDLKLINNFKKAAKTAYQYIYYYSG